ncbi:uncharacterized protein LOC143290929 [Babylonia areolata]|uniref:uncharacterized protein LOC143290929 n=1 Tax=Babylonia areolata TaxID=304850 RepID=UPI003FD4805A
MVLAYTFGVVMTFLLCSHGSQYDGEPGAYAVLSVPHNDLTLLLDTQHRYLTVKEVLNNTCYLVALETAPNTALHLIIHIYHRGLGGLMSEFRVERAVSTGWLSRLLGSEHTRFCQHSLAFLLRSVVEETTAKGERKEDENGPEDTLVG